MTQSETVLLEVAAALGRITELISFASKDRRYSVLLLVYASDILSHMLTILNLMESLLKASASPSNSGIFDLLMKLLDSGFSLERLSEGLKPSPRNMEESAEITFTLKSKE